MSSFWRDGMSVKETKFSMLMLSFVVTLGFALWQFFMMGYIDGSMLTLLAYLIGAITGINIVDNLKNKDSNYNNNVGN